MHILFLTDNFPPETNAPANRTFEHCRQWVQEGHKVTVVTCVPNFPKGEVFEGYRNSPWSREEMAGIRVVRVWSYITRNEGFAKRILDYLSYMVSGSVGSLFVRRPDIVIGTSPQFFTACAAYFVATVKRRPWVFELRDIWPESIRAVGAMQESRLLAFLERLELFLYRKATKVVAVTHAFKSNLVSRGIDASKIEVVTNGVDADAFAPAPKDPELESTLGLKDKFVAGYIGTHGLAHSLDTLVDAAAMLRDKSEAEHFRIIMLGDGADRLRLQERARSLRLTNMIFVDSVPRDQIARYWSLLDVSIIHLKKSDLFTNVIPSKLFECMAMGIPVLQGVRGESAEIVERTEVGLTFEPENANALVDQLVMLHSDRALADEFRRNGPVAARQYDRKVLALKMLDVLKMVQSKS